MPCSPTSILLSANLSRVYHQFRYLSLRLSSTHSRVPSGSLEDSMKMAITNKEFYQIPNILTSSKDSCKNQNHFLFLSSFTMSHRTQVVDEMLQSFISFKPHTRLEATYHYLLTYTLQSSHPFPLALAILQRTLRSGCNPVPQIYVLLSSAWVNRQPEFQSVLDVLLGMRAIGYRPDCGTSNFIMKSLCAVDKLEEAVEVLRGMYEVACVPDVESYCTVIAAFCEHRKTNRAVAMMEEMAGNLGLSPRQGTLVRLMASLRAYKEIWRGVLMIEFLEKKGFQVGFESYELIVEGCLECNEFILVGKVAMMMAENGYIPYIRVRQKVVEGLAGVGEWELACVVRHRFAEMNS